MKTKRTVLFALGAVATAGWTIARLRRGDFSFAGKAVLITGGSRGLGLVLARRICAEGGRVALLARDADELARAREELCRNGGEVLTVICDLSDRAQIENAFAHVVDRFGGIDVLINNAGIIEVGPLDHMQRVDFEKALTLHFWAAYELIMLAAPEMRRRGGGRIVNITSIGGKIAVPHLAPYCASKFALVGLSDAVRAELAADDIRVTTVAPGMMRTGSHVNARFKGAHAAEFAWFSASNSTPFLSIGADRAAAQILRACRRGDASLTITLAARLAIAGNAILPNFTGEAMKLVSRFLPQRVDAGGEVLKSGWESRAAAPPPGWLTHLSDEATRRNNEAQLDGDHSERG